MFTLADAAKETIREQSAAIFDLFLEREAEFSVHGSVEMDYPDLSDASESGFLADSAYAHGDPMLTAATGHGWCSDGGWLPAMGQQLLHPSGLVRRQPREHLLEVRIGVRPACSCELTGPGS